MSTATATHRQYVRLTSRRQQITYARLHAAVDPGTCERSPQRMASCYSRKTAGPQPPREGSSADARSLAAHVCIPAQHMSFDKVATGERPSTRSTCTMTLTRSLSPRRGCCCRRLLALQARDREAACLSLGTRKESVLIISLFSCVCFTHFHCDCMRMALLQEARHDRQPSPRARASPRERACASAWEAPLDEG